MSKGEVIARLEDADLKAAYLRYFSVTLAEWVAAEDAATGPRNWRLDRIRDVVVSDTPGAATIIGGGATANGDMVTLSGTSMATAVVSGDGGASRVVSFVHRRAVQRGLAL